MPTKRLALSLAQAVRLTNALRERDERADPTAVRTWPIWKVRAAWLWTIHYDSASRLRWAPRGLDEFLRARQGMPSCRGCGCTADNACRDRRTHEPCSWVEPGLCSACKRKESRRTRVDHGPSMAERTGSAGQPLG